MELRTETAKSKEGRLTSFYAIVNYLLKQFATEDNIATVEADIWDFRQGSLTATGYAQQLWKKTLTCGSIYNEKILKGLFVEGVHRSIY